MKSGSVASKLLHTRISKDMKLKTELTLDGGNEKLRKIFLKITKNRLLKGKSKVTKDMFAEFLSKRYPENFVNVMI